MISSLQPHLVLGLAGPWAETLLAVAALAGMGYAWRWHIRPTPGDGQPKETVLEPGDVPARPPAKPELEVSTPSWVDDLTGLPDLGYLRKKFCGAQEKPSPLTLLTISVQGKSGDQPTGDEPCDRALAEVAHTLRSTLRASDTCVRATSGQLMAVLPGLDADTSANLVIRVKRAVESLALVTRSGEEIRLAVQVGCACVPQDGTDLDALLDAARADVERGRVSHGGSATERISRAAPIIPN
jgi:diguanylate cyclase (GGDEF)-like protein